VEGPAERRFAMAMRPRVHCSINFIEPITGQVMPTKAPFPMAAELQFKVRYVVANDADEPTGDFTLVAAFMRDGVRETPNPVPAQVLSLGPGGIKTFEHTYYHPAFGTRQFKATMAAGLATPVGDDGANLVTATLAFTEP
jgi:hypothetical protein